MEKTRIDCPARAWSVFAVKMEIAVKSEADDRTVKTRIDCIGKAGVASAVKTEVDVHL